jgi:hypothetical protein
MSPDEAMTDGTARAAGTGAALDGARGLPSDPRAIEDLIARRRVSLAATVDELALRARPKEILRRSAADAAGRLRGFVRAPEGGLRTERIVAVATAAVAVAGLVVLLRSRLGHTR